MGGRCARGREGGVAIGGVRPGQGGQEAAGRGVAWAAAIGQGGLRRVQGGQGGRAEADGDPEQVRPA